MITEPRLPDPECRRWYASVLKQRELMRQWSDPRARIIDQLAFWRKYAVQQHELLVEARRKET